MTADDSDRSRNVHVDPEPSHTTDGADLSADVRLHGDAVDLYLALCNCGGEISDEQGIWLRGTNKSLDRVGLKP